MTNFIYSLITFLIAIFFVLLGFIGVLIPWSGAVRAEVISLVTEHSIAISLFGFTFIAIGIAVAFQILLATRLSYYQFTVGNDKVEVSEEVILKYLNGYWHSLFEGQEIPCNVSLKNNKIHVTADIPFVALPQQEDLLEKIQKELSELFFDFLGYRQEFHLEIGFHPEKKHKHAQEPV
jgi:hypothetical protein